MGLKYINVPYNSFQLNVTWHYSSDVTSKSDLCGITTLSVLPCKDDSLTAYTL